MAQNYILLERIELNASAASVTFSSIPQTGYTDLKMVVSQRSDNAGSIYSTTYVRFNGDTNNANYSSKMLEGSGSSASSYAQYIYMVGEGATSTANTFANGEIYIPNYTGSALKSVSIDNVMENNATTAYSTLGAALWNSTAAITSVTVFNNGANYQSGSTFSLYGIAAVGTTPAVAPKADGGNVIATDGTYWYHAFLSNGTFTPQVGLSADCLVIAGGGAGGGNYGGGGGAGGFRSATSLSLSASGYAVTVGAGGAGASLANGGNGTTSIFSSISTTGGGGGGCTTGSNNGASGGSGGGASRTGTVGAGNAGSYSPVEGYAGGAGNDSSPNYGTGGGGGASHTGWGGITTAGGYGGDGSNAFSTWASATSTGVSGYYAGGGGGGFYGTGGSVGVGGAGGGGNAGATNTNGVAGTTNTGSGGGGSSVNGTPVAGGNGGSGIVIVRYLVA